MIAISAHDIAAAMCACSVALGGIDELGPDDQPRQLEEHRVVCPLERVPRARQQHRVGEHGPEGAGQEAAHEDDGHHAARFEHAFSHVEARVCTTDREPRLRDAVAMVEAARIRAKPHAPDDAEDEANDRAADGEGCNLGSHIELVPHVQLEKDLRRSRDGE